MNESTSGCRRDPITQQVIVETALRILDSEGLEGLSMRRIAEELDLFVGGLARRAATDENRARSRSK